MVLKNNIVRQNLTTDNQQYWCCRISSDRTIAVYIASKEIGVDESVAICVRLLNFSEHSHRLSFSSEIDQNEKQINHFY